MKVLVLLAMSLVSFNASADYFKAGVGYNIGGEVEYSTASGSVTGDLDNTFMSPLLLAYGFEMMGDVHGEIELAYRQHEYDPSGTAEPTLLTGAFNVVGNVPVGGITMTGGAGAFFGQFDTDSTGGGKGTGFGLQLFAGVDFLVGNDVTLGGEFRYLTTVSDFSLDNDVDGEYNSTAIMFNAKFGM